MKFECVQADVCLPEYWGGHHLPHVAIYPFRGMTIAQVRKAIKDELREDAIMGGHDMYEPDGDTPDDVYHAMVNAVDRLQTRDGLPDEHYMFLPEVPDDAEGDNVMAYFVFVPQDV